MNNKTLTKFLAGLKLDRGILEDNTVLYEGDSAFHHITIREEGETRTMYFGELGDEAETSINLKNPDKAVFEYPGMMLAALPLYPEGRRVVMMGLGGGFLPGLFQRFLPDYRLIVVEVDVQVGELAQTYSAFNPGGNAELILGDGRDYLESLGRESVDQIWLDAFSGNYVPKQLSGLHFLRLCQEKMTPGGLLVQNLHQSRPLAFQNQLKTTEAAFGDFLALDGTRCGNSIVISRKAGGPPGPAWKKLALEAAAKKFPAAKLGPYNLVKEMGKIRQFDLDPYAVVID